VQAIMTVRVIQMDTPLDLSGTVLLHIRQHAVKGGEVVVDDAASFQSPL